MSTTAIRRGALLVSVALLLGACEWGLTFTPGVAHRGETVTVTNDGHVPCLVEVGEEEPELVPGETDVVVFVVTSVVDTANAFAAAASGGGLDALDDVIYAVTTSDEDGVFSVEIPAPSIPGEHLVVAFCGGSLEDLDAAPAAQEALLAVQATLEDVDLEALELLLFTLLADESRVDLLPVEQAGISLTVDRSTVTVGESVVATIDWCQAENDFDVPALVQAQAREYEEEEGELSDEDLALLQTFEELAGDHPDLEVYVDGELVETVTADERYPTGEVQVTLPLHEVGTHEIKGVCRYQTFDLEAEMVLSPVVDYPFPPEDAEVVPSPGTWDEAELMATASVEVVAAATGTPAAQPVVAAPAYTG